jgi:hypothetical protein
VRVLVDESVRVLVESRSALRYFQIGVQGFERDNDSLDHLIVSDDGRSSTPLCLKNPTTVA